MPLSVEETRRRNAARVKKQYATSEKYRRQQKSAKLFKAYAITLEQYEAWSKTHNDECFICESKCPTKKRLAVDHNHKTGLVRGLLCINCNKGIGNFKDNIDLLKAAIEYLEFAKETEEYVNHAINSIEK